MSEIKSVIESLKSLDEIERPDMDNHGAPINCNSVFPYLSPEDQTRVNEVIEILQDYVRTPNNEPNKRAITQLNKNGFDAALHGDQYDAYKLAGEVLTENWKIDISDD